LLVVHGHEFFFFLGGNDGGGRFTGIGVWCFRVRMVYTTIILDIMLGLLSFEHGWQSIRDGWHGI
jgi:hypothetical protein